MTDEEIKNKAKETSGGNYYYEQGFIYGFELGEEAGRKVTEAHLLDNWCRNEEGYCPHLNRLEKENAELKEQLEVTNKENERIRRTMLTYSECITEHQNTIKRKDEQNKLLAERVLQLQSDKGKLIDENRKMRCCENCKDCRTGNCTEDKMFYARTTRQCNDWKFSE